MEGLTPLVSFLPVSLSGSIRQRPCLTIVLLESEKEFSFLVNPYFWILDPDWSPLSGISRMNLHEIPEKESHCLSAVTEHLEMPHHSLGLS